MAAPCALALTPEQVFRGTEQSALVLEVLSEKGGVIASYSALALDRGRAVTQCDLLEGGSAFRLSHRGGTTQATLDRRDGERGLCLLAAAGMNAPPVRLAPDKPPVGAPVYAVSNALGLGTSITEGVVAGVREHKADFLIQFTAPIAPGSDGGGLFDSEGRLVGMIVYRLTDGQNVNFALPARWLSEIERRAASVAAAPAWAGKALAYAREENWQGLAEHARRWAAAAPDSDEAWLWVGDAEMRRREWRSAELAYREALKRAPGSAPAAAGAAWALLAQGQPQAALDVVRPLLAVRSEDARLLTVAGAAARRLGQPDLAQRAYETALRVAPWNREALLGLADVALDRRDWRKRVSVLRQLTERWPNDSGEWIRLAEAYAYAARPERALAAAERARSLDPLSADALVWKGAALWDLKRHGEAIETLKESLRGNPSARRVAWHFLGGAYSDVRLYPEAIAAYREALKLAPDNKAVRIGLAVALKDGGHRAEALALFEQLKTELPDDPLPWRQIGYVHAQLAQPEKAIPAYERSLAIDPKQPRVWQALMEAYHAAGRRDDVKRAYDKLVALDRNWSETAYRRLILPYEVGR